MYKVLNYYLYIFVLVPEMLCDELHRLCGLVRLRTEEDVADVTVPPVRQGALLLERLASVQLAGRGVQVTQLQDLIHKSINELINQQLINQSISLSIIGKVMIKQH